MHCRKFTDRADRQNGQPLPLSCSHYRQYNRSGYLASAEHELGVKPVLNEHFENLKEMFDDGVNDAIRELGLQPGDKIVLTGGDMNGKPGNTNIIKVETVK